jgi:hypothetical protein
MPAPGTPIFNNLTSPEARGSFGTVAQEETTDKTTPPIKTLINIDFIITNLLPIMSLSFFSSSPDPPPSPSLKTHPPLTYPFHSYPWVFFIVLESYFRTLSFPILPLKYSPKQTGHIKSFPTNLPNL